ncbi:MAG: Mut7-C RNAse domain-containing protein [Candidatus Hydrothermarchaeaceae archaeon]
MQFIADTMLGKLSRWLRLMGYDVLYKSDAEDNEIIANAKKRTVLTRDRMLFEKAKSEGLYSLLIRSTDLKNQLLQLKEEIGIELQDAPKLSRCPLCNGEVESIEKEKVRDKVPPKVFENSEFWICKNCQKIYWEGGHWKNIKEIVKDIENEMKNVQNPKK